jgi:hypothetical protein
MLNLTLNASSSPTHTNTFKVVESPPLGKRAGVRGLVLESFHPSAHMNGLTGNVFGFIRCQE